DEIVGLLTRAGEGPAAPALFIVGDEKQSIYRFRGADVTVFNRVREPAPRPLPLRENRRSTRAILNFVNAMGAHVMHAEAPNGTGEQVEGGPRPPYWIKWHDDHALKPLRSGAFNPPVELITAVGCDGSATDRRELEARALARRILEFVQPGTMVVDARTETERQAAFGDIAILLRAFTDVGLYERALVDAEIDCYTVKGRGFYGC